MKKVLIVDDEWEFVKDFGKALGMFGYEALQAVDGEGAFSIIENKKLRESFSFDFSSVSLTKELATALQVSLEEA